MHIERPTFKPNTRMGYDPDSVDRAVDWAMDRIRQDDPLEQSEVDALRFRMARRKAYAVEEVDAWFDSLRDSVASQAHAPADTGRPPAAAPDTPSGPFPGLDPASSPDPFATSPAPTPDPPAPAPSPSRPEVPPELRGASDEPRRERGHRAWVQTTALVLIVALLAMFIVSYFL